MLFTGVPGTGKTTLAETITKEHNAALLNWDWLMSGLRIFPDVWDVVWPDAELRRDVGYSLMNRMIEYRLRLGQSSVLDCVARPRAIDHWRGLCDESGAVFVAIECSLADQTEHRARIEGRDRAIPGWDELVWEFVANSRKIYEPCGDPKLTLDATHTINHNLNTLRAHLDHVLATSANM